MKTNNFQYTPDAGTGGTGDETNKKPVRTRTIPKADIDFMDVAKAVAQNWLTTPGITLLWKTSADFDKAVQAYSTSLEVRINTGSLRPGQTLTLVQLDKQIEEAVGEVKIYIEKKYKRANAPAQFARFGIIKENRAYVMSQDRNNRKAALKQMVDTIAAEGFGNEEYGTAFWTDIKTAYDAALATASTTTGEVSSKVATKNEQKKSISKVLTALLFVLRGNYPETYKEIYRQWGWRKESY
jgi:hypothetical protein